MRTLKDGNKVSRDGHEFIVRWNNLDESFYIKQKFGASRIADLNIQQYRILWLHVTTKEYLTYADEEL